MNTDFKLDMTMMLLVHDAFRRDLELVATTTIRCEGWDRFAKLLHLHHTAEDEALWPVLRNSLVGHPDDLALVDEMEAQHAALDPRLEAIESSFDGGEPAPRARAELATLLTEHLVEEETRALPLIDRTLSDEEWMQFGQASAAMIGPDMPVFLPWMLDGADDDRTKAALALLPGPAQQTYWNEWQPAYAAKDSWAERARGAPR